jgi:hypothetical protein
MRLRESYTIRGNFIVTETRPYRPDKEVKEKHVELLLVRDENYLDKDDRVRDGKTKIPFRDIEFVSIECNLFRRVFIVKPVLVITLKPEKTVYRLEVDRVVREIRFNIARKDLPIARKFQTAIMFELSNANLEKLVGF